MNSVFLWVRILLDKRKEEEKNGEHLYNYDEEIFATFQLQKQCKLNSRGVQRVHLSIIDISHVIALPFFLSHLLFKIFCFQKLQIYFCDYYSENQIRFPLIESILIILMLLYFPCSLLLTESFLPMKLSMEKG